MKIKTKPVIMLLLMLLTASAFTHTTVRAQEEKQRDREVVIVMDCSKSMENVDSQYLAFDFVKGLAASLPENCEIGLVTFNNEVCASLPIGSGFTEIEHTLDGLQYRQYGNAGAGMEAAVALFGDEQAEKSVILLSDGEIMMDTGEGTEASVMAFRQAVADARDRGVEIDVLALGEKIQEGYTVYSAADETGGNLYEIADADGLSKYIDRYLFEEWGYRGSHIGKMDGTSAELTVSLPDCMMESAKIILTGEQHNENMTVHCEAGRIDVRKGIKYTVVDISAPVSEDISIQMTSSQSMRIDAYLYAEYECTVDTGHTYEVDTQTARIWVDLRNPMGNSLLNGHLADGGMELYLDGEKENYTVSEGKAWIDKTYIQNSLDQAEARTETQQTETQIQIQIQMEVRFVDPIGNYYGVHSAQEKIIIPAEEKPDIDWFFWSVIAIFITAVTAVFCISHSSRRRQHTISRQMVDMGTAEPLEKGAPKSDFTGKIVVYVIHNKNDIDYPPESINLFARCRRDSITLEWILDTCNIPLDLKGAEKIIFKPGEDRSLVVRNNSKASVLIGRALLTRGQSYNLYYHEKVTFIFDQEDAEIEVHYKDLKPNEK
ncbi:MAG: VWA domain-containing protein [Lachnospiraceae bacterium]|nr:VWA domain-containing protein [Lachnospiraceae bacterium]